MDTTLILVIAVIVLALIFDFLNGFHDAANSIATIVVTKTLTPGQAVVMAGLANFVGYFTFGMAIAKTVGKGIINIENITLTIVLAALVGAIIWNIITWILGLPTSSSHALIGGLIGSAVAAAGFKAVVLGGVIKIVAFIFLAPLIGMLAASIFTVAIIWMFRKSTPTKANTIFKRLQLVSSFCYSVGHGTNDAQKCMGIIALALFTGGITKTFQLDTWVIISCYCAISLGTMFGGWRIVKTMGTKITKIRPMEGFSAETASAIVLIGTAHFGIPVSTTHVIAGSIMGVGAVEKGAGVRWVTARRIIWAWFLTIPLTALCSALTYFVMSFLLPA
ncbi:MAG TPA: anion permease [Lentisphaeria bacterium]|nr:MAG: inorganic phosphate transporter [Lentisphaerae bacterium GWF2_49_21]HBC87996.1 anion permease [Lentisphaeria bacterium]